VIPSSGAKKALMADFQSLQSDPGIEWWDIPSIAVYAKILEDEKALDWSLKLKPITRKKFYRHEKALDAAMQDWADANA
jgi:hypothetical protein